MPDNDGWYDLRELAELWGLDIVRVRKRSLIPSADRNH